MLDPDRGNITRCASFPDAEAAVRRVGELWQADDVPLETWMEARSAARSAIQSLAMSTAAETVLRSAELAVDSAEWAARAAAGRAEAAKWSAESAAWSAAWSAGTSGWSEETWSAHHEWMADLLITLLQDAPTAVPA
jgi:hypothetical protein